MKQISPCLRRRKSKRKRTKIIQTHIVNKLLNIMRSRQKIRKPVKRVKFRNNLCDYMPFRSAHRHDDDSATAPNYPDSTPDNQSNITEIVNALRDTSRESSEAFKIDFMYATKRPLTILNTTKWNTSSHSMCVTATANW